MGRTCSGIVRATPLAGRHRRQKPQADTAGMHDKPGRGTGSIEEPQCPDSIGIALFGRGGDPAAGFRFVGIHAMPHIITYAEVILGARMILFGSPPEAGCRFGTIHSDTPSLNIADPEIVLSVGIALQSGHAVPLHRRGVIPDNTEPVRITDPEVVLGAAIVLCSSLSEPYDRLRIIPAYTLARKITIAQSSLGVGIALLRSPAVTGNGLREILRQTPPLLVTEP